jgi:hypothetical protein
MKKLVIICILVICGASVTFGQLKVANNSGRDLKVTINGDTKTIAFKSESTFGVRVREANMDIIDPVNNQKFYLTKKVSGSGRVQIEPGDCAIVQTQTTTVVSSQVYNQPAQVISTQTAAVPSGVKTGSISDLFGDVSASTGQASPQVAGQTNTQTTQTTQTMAPIINQPQAQQQNQVYLSRIRVVYTGAERCKVFSNFGGDEWQGLEFRGKVTADIKDNTRNSYNLPVQTGKDLQIGLVFKPGEAINEYANVRKRVNPGDTVFYINEGDIKKMSFNKEAGERPKMVVIICLCKEYNLVFTDPENPSKRISLSYGEKSIAFKSPIGQFYLQASPQKVSTKENQPTVYLSEQVTEKTDIIKIYDQDIKRCLDSPLKGINLYWEGK